MITDDDDFNVFSFDELISPEELSDQDERLEDIINNPESDFANEIKDKGKEISNYIKQYINKNAPNGQEERDSMRNSNFESGSATETTLLFATSVQDPINNRVQCQEINQMIRKNETKQLSRLLSNFQIKGFLVSNEIVKGKLLPFKRTLVIDQNNNQNQYIRIQNVNGLDVLLDLDKRKYIVPKNHKNNPAFDQINLYFSILAGMNTAPRGKIRLTTLRKNCDEVFDRIRRNPL